MRTLRILHSPLRFYHTRMPTLARYWLLILLCSGWLDLHSTVGLPAAPSLLFSKEPSPEILELINGDTLRGYQNGFEEGKVRWILPTDSEILIPLDSVKFIDYQVAPVEHQLAVPETIEKPLVQEIPSVVKEELPAPDTNEELSIEIDQIEGRWFPATWDSLVRGFDFTREQTVAWTKRVEFGGRYLTGNSQEEIATVSARLQRTIEKKQIQVNFRGQYRKANGNLVRNLWNIDGTIDFAQKNDKHILFVTVDNVFDEVRNITWQGTLSAGLGYRFVNESKKLAIIRLGPGTTYEIFDNPVTHSLTANIHAELEIRWPLHERVGFEHKASISPSVESLDVFRTFRLRSDTGLLFRLDDENHWRLKLGMLSDYNAKPNDPTQRVNYTALFSIIYEQK